MADEAEKKIPNIKIIDPVGIIRARAKVLYLEAGSPEGKDWADYFSAAEGELINRGKQEPSRKKPRDNSPPVKTERMQKASASENVLLSIIGAVLHAPLTDHEAIGLGYLLTNNNIRLKDGTLIKALTPREAGEILAEVADEYESAFLEKNKVADGFSAPIEERIVYWETLIIEARDKDEALTNLDRLTMARLVQRIKDDKRVEELVFVG